MTFTISLGLVFSGAVTDSPVAAFMFVFAVYFLSAVGYSAYAVPYLALAAEVTDDPPERVSIVSRRMLFVMLGIMLGSAAAPMLVSMGGGGVSGYRFMGVIVAGLSFAAILVTLQLVSGIRSTVGDRVDDSNWRAKLGLVFSDRSYLWLLSIFAIQTLSGTVFLALLPYVVSLVWLGDESQVGILMLVLLVSSTCALPLWEALARRFSSEYAFMGAAILGAGAYGTLYLVHLSGLDSARIPAFMLMGVAFAGAQLLPFAMAAERIHRKVRETGVPCEAVFTGVWTSVEKLALSLGAPVAALVLGVSGYSQAWATADGSGSLLLAGAVAAPIVGQCLSVFLLLQARRPTVALGLKP